MHHDTDGGNRLGSAHGTARLSAAAAIAGLASLALLAPACGGASKSPGVASAGGTTSITVATSGSSGSSAPAGSDSSGESSQPRQLQFAHCMRSHGVPDYPDPRAGGGFLNAISASGINTQSPTYHGALRACKKYTPAGKMTPAQSAADNAKGLQFSQCMRSHGVPSYPDPSTGPAGEQVMDLRGLGIDLNSPTFQAANKACQKIIPGSK